MTISNRPTLSYAGVTAGHRARSFATATCLACATWLYLFCGLAQAQEPSGSESSVPEAVVEEIVDDRKAEDAAEAVDDDIGEQTYNTHDCRPANDMPDASALGGEVASDEADAAADEAEPEGGTRAERDAEGGDEGQVMADAGDQVEPTDLDECEQIVK